MTNRVTLIGKLLDAPKIRSFEARGATLETVSLWIETSDGARVDRFTIDVTCAKAGAAAKALPAGALVEINGKLRHDRWKDKQSQRWTGKVFIAIDPAHFSGAVFAKQVTALVKSITAQDGARLPNARREANRKRLAKEGLPIDAALLAKLEGFRKPE